MPFDAVARFLDEELGFDPLPLVGQIAIWQHGELVLDHAVDPDGRFASSSLLNIWCGTKPVVHVAILSALWSESLHEAPIGRLLAPELSARLHDGLREMTAADVISHRFPLAEPHVLAAMMCPPEQRSQRVLEAIERSRPGHAPAGTYAATWLLVEAVEASLGLHGAEIVEQWCSRHLRHADEVVFDVSPSELPVIAERIVPYVLENYDEPIVAYHDRSPEIACSSRLYAGGYASGRALGEFYSVLAGHGAESSDFLAWLWSREPSEAEDPGMDGATEYVSGFHVRIPGVHEMTMLGHPGLTGASYGLAIPEHGLGVGLIVNRFFQSRTDIDFLRSRLVNLILRHAGDRVA